MKFSVKLKQVQTAENYIIYRNGKVEKRKRKQFFFFVLDHRLIHIFVKLNETQQMRQDKLRLQVYFIR